MGIQAHTERLFQLYNRGTCYTLGRYACIESIQYHCQMHFTQVDLNLNAKLQYCHMVTSFGYLNDSSIT